jgi:Protein of unknown function (DUF3135)
VSSSRCVGILALVRGASQFDYQEVLGVSVWFREYPAGGTMIDSNRNRTLPEFSVLLALARSDPRALERLRERLTNDVIRHARSPALRRRLRGLKFRIDMERRRARDPLQACIRLSAMMHRSFADLHAVLTAPDRYRSRTRRVAQVLAFPPHDQPL